MSCAVRHSASAARRSGEPAPEVSSGSRLSPSCCGLGGSPAMARKVGPRSMLEPSADSRVPGAMPGPRARNGMCTSDSYGCCFEHPIRHSPSLYPWSEMKKTAAAGGWPAQRFNSAVGIRIATRMHMHSS
jgi:hypothetical protein